MSKKIKVAVFLNSVVRGGVEEHVILLCKNLSKERFESIVVCPPLLAELIEDDLEGFARVVRIDIRSFSSLGEIMNLYRFLRKEGVDIVHSHLFFASRMSHFIARLAGVPVTIETGHIREAWRKGFLRTFYYIDRFYARFTDRFIAVSEAVAKYFVEVKGIGRERITVIANGINTGKFEPGTTDEAREFRSKLAIDKNSPLISVVARLDLQKGHTYLIKAAPSIIEKYPDIIFLIVGIGATLESLKAEVAALGLDKSFIFAGFRKDIPAVMNGSDIIVLPSLYEGMPLAVIEAALSARPIVATAVDGTPEVLQDNETGLLVPPSDPESLSRAIIKLLDDPARAARMGRAARAHALTRFDIKRQARETEELYLKALADKGIKDIKGIEEVAVEKIY